MAQVILTISVDSTTNSSADRVSGKFILSDDPYAPVPSDANLLAFAESINWEPLFGSDYASTEVVGLAVDGAGRTISVS